MRAVLLADIEQNPRNPNDEKSEHPGKGDQDK